MKFSKTEHFDYQTQPGPLDLLDLFVGTKNTNFEYLVKKEEQNISNEIERCSSLESVLSENQTDEQIIPGKFLYTENKVITNSI